MADMDEFIACCSPDGHIPVNALYLHNSLVDARVYELGWSDVHGLADLLKFLLPAGYTELVLPTKYDQCPAVRLFLEEWDKTSPTNFKLQNLLSSLGIKNVSCRCKGVLAVGICDQHQSDVYLNIPAEVYMTSLPLIPVGIDGRVDICCDHPVGGVPCHELGTVCSAIRGPLEFSLYIRCAGCNKKACRCSGILPCPRCKEEVCMPREEEWIERAKDVGIRVKANRIAHHDLAKYILHTQAAYFKGAILMGKDAPDVSMRVEGQPALPMIECQNELPADMKTLVESSPYGKIEWMYGGQYRTWHSEGYKTLIMDPNVQKSIASKTKLPPKLVDTVNLAFPTRAYETWIASMDYPGVIAEFTGAGWWRDGKLLWTKIRMMSLRFGVGGVLTVTSVHRYDV